MRVQRAMIGVLLTLGMAVAGGFAPVHVAAQGPEAIAKRAFFHGLAEHFKVPVQEIGLLADSRVEPEEVPVVLLIATRAGISPEAVLSLRRGDRGWAVLAQRYRLTPQTLRVPVEDPAPLGALARLYGEFATRPPSEWSEINLTDEEVVWLVNLRVMSDLLDVAPDDVLKAVDAEGGSFLGAFTALARH